LKIGQYLTKLCLNYVLIACTTSNWSSTTIYAPHLCSLYTHDDAREARSTHKLLSATAVKWSTKQHGHIADDITVYYLYNWVITLGLPRVDNRHTYRPTW